MSGFFNRKVRIDYNPSSSFGGEWSLGEYEQDGDASTRDLTPWRWTLSFNCQSLSVIRSISNIKFISDDESIDVPKELVRINGKLVSTGGEWGQALEYSYLGTDRQIEIFILEIIEASGDEAEGCTLYASPKHEYESIKNFSRLVSEDELYISVKLKAAKIAEIARLIDQDVLENATISICNADGLFSHWSPTIYTNFIKILPDGCDIDGLVSDKGKPTTAGEVGEFQIVFKSRDKVFGEIKGDDDEISEQERIDQTNSEHKQWISRQVANAVDVISSIQKSLLVPLWLISALLFMLLFK
jgi:hypothetical protein